jgi:hypothetical protein
MNPWDQPMSRLKPETPLQMLLGDPEGTTVKPFPDYLRANFRKAFWELAIFWWGMMAILVVGLTIVLTVNSEYRGALVTLGAGIAIGGLIGAIAGAVGAPSFLRMRWRRDIHEERVDLMKSVEPPTKEPS